MSKKLNYGPRFRGNGIFAASDHIPHNKTTATAPGRSMWWTQERVEKLLYIVEKYNDWHKAARVLGCEYYQVCLKMKQIRFEKRQARLKKEAEAEERLMSLLLSKRIPRVEVRDPIE